VIFNGTVYVAGGSGSGNAPVATVYRAVIQSDGMLGNWQALPSLPFARSYFGFGVNGTSLYALGCDSGSVTPNDSSLSAKAIGDVIYAEIDVHTGNLSAAGWTANGNKLKKAVSKQTAVVAGCITATRPAQPRSPTPASTPTGARPPSTVPRARTRSRQRAGATCSTTPRPGTWMRPARFTSWSWAGTT